MSAREVIAYAITRAPKGVKGGPYEGYGEYGNPARSTRDAMRWAGPRAAESYVVAIRAVVPDARVIRIVRARPSEASAVEVLRAMVAWVDSKGGGFNAIIARARRVLASAGPDPSEVVRAAMAWGLACKRYGGRPLDLEIKTLEAVDAYRKAGGK